jgi:hypothetical protein
LERLRMIATQQADCVDNQKRLAQLEALVAHFTQIARPIRPSLELIWQARLRRGRFGLCSLR